MAASMTAERRADLLTTIEKPQMVKAKLTLTRRETASQMLRRAVRRSDLKLDTIGDHGQVSRQIDDKENLSFHHMVATWPVEIWRELIPLLAEEFGGSADVVIRVPIKRTA